MHLAWQATKFALLLAVFGYLLINYDISKALPQVFSQDVLLLLTGTAIIAFQIIIAAIRWHFILRTLRLPVPIIQVVKVSYIAAFFNTWIPGGVAGDVVRTLLVRDQKTGLTRAFNSVLIDRIVAVVALFLLGAVIQPFLWSHVLSNEVAVAILLIALLGLACIAVLTRFDRIINVDQNVISFQGYLSMLRVLAGDARAVFWSSREVLVIFTCAFLSHLALSIPLFVFATGLGLTLTINAMPDGDANGAFSGRLANLNRRMGYARTRHDLHGRLVWRVG